MELASPIYFLLLLGLPLLYWSLPRKARPPCLLLASYLFYAWFDLRYVPVLFASTLLDYSMGLWIGRTSQPEKRLGLASVSILANLLILATFKYSAPFLAAIHGLLNLAGIHAEARSTPISFVPLGVSFYTFHSISYVVDVYRRRIEPIRSFPEYSLYVTFFPKLISGPIERAENFLPQLRERTVLGVPLLLRGVGLLAAGYFLKLCLAERLAGVAGLVFANPSQFPVFERWLGLYAFTFQIYADFLGYTKIAQGTALLFGIRLSENFRSPYLAENPQDFWRRWHVTLSSWFRDYVYVPLGGGRQRMVFNVVLTMALAGLWHGAGGHFVAWGLYHAGLLIACRKVPWPRAPRLVKIFVTFHLVAIGWIFFKAGSVAEALAFGRGLVDFRSVPATGVPQFVALFALLGVIAELSSRLYARMSEGFRPRAFAAGLPLGLLVFLVLLFGVTDANPFVYFQF